MSRSFVRNARGNGWTISVRSSLEKVLSNIESYGYKTMEQEKKAMLNDAAIQAFRKAVDTMTPLKGSSFGKFAYKTRLTTKASEDWNVGWTGKRGSKRTLNKLKAMANKAKVVGWGEGFAIEYNIPDELRKRFETSDYIRDVKWDKQSGYYNKHGNWVYSQRTRSDAQKAVMGALVEWIKEKNIKSGKEAVSMAAKIVASWSKKQSKPKVLNVDGLRLTRNEQAKQVFRVNFAKRAAKIVKEDVVNIINKK